MSEDERWKDLTRTGLFLLAVCLAGLAALFLACRGNGAIPIFVAFAAMSVAGLLGFLFAVPRVLQGQGHSPEREDKQQESYRMHVNTNLEQISDWLTKIIVGIGLSQLWNLPSVVGRVASFLSPAFGGETNESLVIATAALVYFTCLGYLSGYLLTRIYLAGAFQRADAHVVAGQLITPEEVRRQQDAIMADLQNQVIAIRNGSSQLKPPLEERLVGEGENDRIRSLLWVDDKPKEIVLMVERLQRIGIEVSLARTTAEALKMLSSHGFGRIISNMGRTEDGKYNPTAGLALIKNVREALIDTRIVIFCDAHEVVNYREAALRVGAYEITSSPTILLDALDLDATETTFTNTSNSSASEVR